MLKKKKLSLNKRIKERLTSSTSVVSGIGGLLGSSQVCHSICLGVVFLLSAFGITIVGMPLFFLQKVSTPAWISAVVFFFITLAFYFKERCISKKALMLNLGVIVAGTPFQAVQPYIKIFWIVGGTTAVLSLLALIKGKLSKTQNL